MLIAIAALLGVIVLVLLAFHGALAAINAALVFLALNVERFVDLYDPEANAPEE
jgi:hypothetical protein